MKGDCVDRGSGAEKKGKKSFDGIFLHSTISHKRAQYSQSLGKGSTFIRSSKSPSNRGLLELGILDRLMWTHSRSKYFSKNFSETNVRRGRNSIGKDIRLELKWKVAIFSETFWETTPVNKGRRFWNRVSSKTLLCASRKARPEGYMIWVLKKFFFRDEMLFSSRCSRSLERSIPEQGCVFDSRGFPLHWSSFWLRCPSILERHSSTTLW